MCIRDRTSGRAIVFLCVALARIAFSEKQDCSVVLLRNSTDAMENSFYNYVENFIKDRKFVEPVSNFLNKGQQNLTLLFFINYNSTEVNVKPFKIIFQRSSNFNDSDFFVEEYGSVNKSMILRKLGKLLQKQVFINNMYNIIPNDEVLNTYLNTLFKVKSQMNVNIITRDSTRVSH